MDVCPQPLLADLRITVTQRWRLVPAYSVSAKAGLPGFKFWTGCVTLGELLTFSVPQFSQSGKLGYQQSLPHGVVLRTE